MVPKGVRSNLRRYILYMYLTYLSDIIYDCLGRHMFWHVIDFLKQKCILPDILLMSGILCMTVYLAFWHSIWHIFFWHSIWYSFGSQILCFMFWLLICCSIGHSIWHARHGILSDIDSNGSSAGRLPAITDHFTGDPWLQIRGVSRMACVIRLGLY